MRQFEGIGEKYARNIWMDLYDRDFHYSIAYDLRLQKVAEALDRRFKSYSDAEAYFVGLAEKAERLPWDVDRLLYHFNDDALKAIERGSG